MPRWRSSLALLGRIGSIEVQAQTSSTVFTTSHSGRLSAAVPDFLAPAFSSTPTHHHRRHNASIARVAFEASVSDPSRCSASSSKAAQEQPQSNGQSHNVDFTSYFDADVPTPSSSVKTAGSLSSSFQDSYKMRERIRQRLDSAADSTELSAAAKQLYNSAALIAERERVNVPSPESCPSDGKRASMLELNKFFIRYLLRTSSQVTRRKRGIVAQSLDNLVVKYLRKLSSGLPRDTLSNAFLARLATRASFYSAKAVLQQILRIAQQTRSDPTAARPPQQAAPTVLITQNVSYNAAALDADGAASLSRLLLELMRGFSHTGQFQLVHTCFKALRKYSLPPTVLHYQQRLIALVQERVIQSRGQSRIDVEQQTQQLQSEILHMKTDMQVDGIPLDDTFLATVVFGLSAPLRSPLSSKTSVAQANFTLQRVRIIFGQIIGKNRVQPLRHMPHLVTAIVQAEIDSFERCSEPGSQISPRAVDRIRGLLRQLDLAPPASQGDAVGLLTSDGKAASEAVSESQLACVALELRLCAALGEIDAGLNKLRLLLAIKPVDGRETTPQTRELILKQRSGCIYLFSASMQQRLGIEGQDAAYEVLKRAFSSRGFERIWNGLHIPPNPTGGFDIEAYDPEATVLRLWKRWFHAWSIDYLSDGSWLPLEHVTSGGATADQKGERYETFTGTYPWQTLKRGLKLLNLVIDQYELRYSVRPPADFRRGITLASAAWEARQAMEDAEVNAKPIPAIARLAGLFVERNVLDNIVKLTLRGGRPATGETMATHVERRLFMLVRTLTRVRVPARTWEHVEASMLRHLAAIDRDVLPTAAVRASMDEIEARKRSALLRNRDLMEALHQATPHSEDGEKLPRETGSIFVLRQMLDMRAQMKKSNPNPNPNIPALQHT